MTEPVQPRRVEHRIERTYEVAATPEQVWDAIATADGISAWMAPTRLDPQVGGEVSFDLGDFVSTGVVTDYTPNHRFAYEEPWPAPSQCDEQWVAEHGPITDDDLSSVTPIATEFLIESASGGSCVLRVVSSAYGSGADWENEFFTDMAVGWDEMLDNLAAHLDKAALGGFGDDSGRYSGQNRHQNHGVRGAGDAAAAGDGHQAVVTPLAFRTSAGVSIEPLGASGSPR